MKEMLRTMPDLEPEMRLPRVLDHIPVDPGLANMLAIFGSAYSSAMGFARVADEANARKARLAALGMTEEQYAEYCAPRGPLSAADFKAILGPSTISKLMARRRKLIAKAKRASPDDAAVGSAIAAMNKPGRAHEL